MEAEGRMWITETVIWFNWQRREMADWSTVDECQALVGGNLSGFLIQGEHIIL